MTTNNYDDIRKLIQLDVDAIEAYDQAIKKVDEASIKAQLGFFKNDHQKHIDRLSDYLAQKGEEVPEKSADIKGYLLEGFTALMSTSGTDGALRAMKTNEKLTNKKYEQACSWDVEKDVKDIILENYQDEKKHLSYIEEQLTVKAK